MVTIQEILKTRTASTEEAIKLFDELPAAISDFMIGRWKGSEIATGHQMDGLLEPWAGTEKCLLTGKMFTRFCSLPMTKQSYMQ